MTLHAKKNTLTKIEDFLLINPCEVLNINEYESKKLLKKVLKHY
jgi:hypothetical protein